LNKWNANCITTLVEQKTKTEELEKEAKVHSFFGKHTCYNYLRDRCSSECL